MTEKPFNGGQWTEARKNQFIRSALRGARWPAKYEAIRRAYIGDGINPRTGRKCKLHQCAKCGEGFPQSQVQVDHIEPVIGPEGFIDWNTYIERLYCEAEGLQVLCKKCHRVVTAMERFKTDEAGVIKRDALRAFRALKIGEKRSALTAHGISASGTSKELVRKYEDFLCSHGNRA